jgi:N-acetylmuramoyl-L-alanine amidase
LAAGCVGPQRKVTPLSGQERPPQPQTPAPEKTPEPAPVVVTPPVIVKPEEVKPAATLPATGWVSLQEWCAQNKLAPPVIHIDPTQTNVVIKNDRGIFEFEPPRRNARWNGLLIGVGFAPQFTNDTTLVNALDVNKVLTPLMLTNAPRKRGGIIVIDAGHGGSNEGAHSHDDKLMEKNLTLDWARRVQKLLAGSDWQVFMTRTNDMDLGLTQRVAFAELKKADLFISLHFNSFSTKDQEGLETYCFTPQGMASHLTRGYADDVNLSAPNNAFDVENLLLAHDLHRAMLKKTGRPDRGIRRARFMTVLKGQGRPAVLLEGGYLSNPKESKLIASAEFRQKLAEAVVEALGAGPRNLTSANP